MAEALLWGLIASSSLLIGALLGLRLSIGKLPLGLLLGFGAGALISAVSFELAREALDQGGPGPLAIGLALGGGAYFAGNRLVSPKRPHGSDADASGPALALGALLDGIPEQAAIGISLVAGGGVGVALVAAVFISNVPEAFGSADAMQAAGRSNRHVVALWLVVCLVTTLATLLGYGALSGASGDVIGGVQAFAAGAVLVMLTDTMIPEAVTKARAYAGLIVVLGFAVAALLSETQ